MKRYWRHSKPVENIDVSYCQGNTIRTALAIHHCLFCSILRPSYWWNLQEHFNGPGTFYWQKSRSRLTIFTLTISSHFWVHETNISIISNHFWHHYTMHMSHWTQSNAKFYKLHWISRPCHLPWRLQASRDMNDFISWVENQTNVTKLRSLWIFCHDFRLFAQILAFVAVLSTNKVCRGQAQTFGGLNWPRSYRSQIAISEISETHWAGHSTTTRSLFC